MTTHQSRSLGAVPRRSPGPEEHEACPPDLLPADQIGLVERILRDFLQSLGQGLGRYLETQVTASMAGLEQMPAADFLSSREGAWLMTLELGSIPGLVFLSLPTVLVSRVLDMLIGAPQQAESGGRASLTDIELHILQTFFDSLLKPLQEAWAICRVEFKLVSIGSAPPDGAMLPSASSLMVMTSAVRIGDAEASFRLAVPALLVRVAAQEMAQATTAFTSTGPDLSILEALRTATLQVEGVLNGSTLRMSDLLAMEPGQILMLGSPADSSFDCVVNGKVKFRGELIHAGDRQALQIGLRVVPVMRGQAG